MWRLVVGLPGPADDDRPTSKPKAKAKAKAKAKGTGGNSRKPQMPILVIPRAAKKSSLKSKELTALKLNACPLRLAFDLIEDGALEEKIIAPFRPAVQVKL